MTASHDLARFAVPCFEMVNCFSKSVHTGGVSMYIDDRLTHEIVSNKTVGANWFLSVDISNSSFNGIFGGVYHSPSSSDRDFVECFESWLQEVVVEDKTNVIAGDFNIRWGQGPYSLELRNATDVAGLKQKITEYTRSHGGSRSIIDLVFSNIDECDASVVEEFKISDHETIGVCVPGALVVSLPDNKKTFVSWKKYSKSRLQALLRSDVTLQTQEVSVDAKAKVYSSSLVKAVSELTEERVVRATRSNAWFGSSLQMLKQQRDDAYKTYKRTSSEECWQRYKILRNLYVKELRNAKNGSVRQEIDRCSGDSKRLWKCLKSLITPGGMKKSSIVFEGDEGGSCSDEMTARKVNKFFVKSVEEIHKSIPAPQLPEVSSLPPQNLFDSFQPITMEKLIEIVASLKKCSGTENITKQVLLDSLGIVGGKLLEIVNVSLQQGVFPKEWKKSTVIPIPKVAKSTKPEDHRPINMLPLYEKVLETVVKEQLLDFINREEILLTEQSGFRKKHSCESALNLLLLKWKQAIENKRTILAVFVDLKRAFETIDRRKLVEVLRRYGIAGNVLKWFSSYLEERTQVTLFNGVLSPEVAVDLGVPQGSVLGPLLFILYMNDIKKALQRSEVNMFADDTVIYVTGSCREECCEILNAELNVFADWLKRKKLKLNVSKTKCMLITNQRRDDTDGTVYIDGEVVERVDVIKYLGVMLDNKLNFDEHINYTIRKAARKLGIMYRLNKYLSFDNKLMIYNTLIAPHFDYCASILFTATQQQQKRMQLLQNKVMRLILGCERLTPRSFMLDCLRWMSVRQRVEYNTLVFIFRLTKGMAPQYLTDTIVYGSDVHQHFTRQAREIRLLNFKMTSTQNSLFYKGYRLFNMLPEATRNSDNLRDFKKFCKSFVRQRPLL